MDDLCRVVRSSHRPRTDRRTRVHGHMVAHAEPSRTTCKDAVGDLGVASSAGPLSSARRGVPVPSLPADDSAHCVLQVRARLRSRRPSRSMPTDMVVWVGCARCVVGLELLLECVAAAAPQDARRPCKHTTSLYAPQSRVVPCLWVGATEPVPADAGHTGFM